MESSRRENVVDIIEYNKSFKPTPKSGAV